MKKWHLIYDTNKGKYQKPVWPDGDPLGVVNAVVISEDVSSRGKFVTIKGIRRNETGFDTEKVTLRTANSSKNLRTERIEPAS